MRKKRWIGIVSCVVAVTAVAAVAAAVFWKGKTKTYATAGNQVVTDLAQYTEKTSRDPDDLGSEENPFTILEIVPATYMGEIGYMIPGCEPVDLNKALKYTATYGEIESQFMNGRTQDEQILSMYKQPERRVFADQIPDTTDSRIFFDRKNLQEVDYGHLPAHYTEEPDEYNTNYNCYTLKKEKLRQDGYYTKVEHGSGKFVLKVDGQVMQEIPTTEEIEGKTCTFEYQDGGDYIWTQEESDTPHETDYTQEQVWTFREEEICYKITEVSVKNNDRMIPQVYQKQSEEWTSRVITVQPDMLQNNPEKMKKIINEADLIYIHGDHSGSSLVSLWNLGHQDDPTQIVTQTDGGLMMNGQKVATKFEENDMDWDTVTEIFKRMAGMNPCGIVLDETSMSYGLNTNKLYYCLLQYAPRVFYETFKDRITKVSTTLSTSGNTGQFQKSETELIAGEWGQETFHVSDYSAMQIKWLKTGNYEIWNKVFAFNGDEAIWQKFLNKVIPEYHNVQNGGQNTEAFDYFQEKNGGEANDRPEKISANEAIEYILRNKNTANRKRHLKILEIEPCSTFVYGNDKDYPEWRAYYRSLFTWLDGSGPDGILDTEDDGPINWEKDIEVRTMASYEFVGNLDDLNSEYDMIIFGPTRDASNGKNGVNDQSVKEYYYTSSGDAVAPNSNTTYTGNDITQKKLYELESFLEAGKPIVVDNLYFHFTNSKTVSVDTSKIQAGSNVARLFAYYSGQNLQNSFQDNLVSNGIYISTSRLEKALMEESCRLEFIANDNSTEEDLTNMTEADYNETFGRPQDYQYTDTTTTVNNVEVSNTIDGATIPYVDDNDRVLMYRFKIHGPEGTKYHVRLYGDFNSNGIYIGSMKEQVELAKNNATTSEENEQIASDFDDLICEANEVYTIERKLGKNYKGILPWKLEVNRVNADGTDNKHIRSSEIGYAAVKSTGGKIQIKVLQMNLCKTMDYEPEAGVRGTINFADKTSIAGRLFEQYTSTLPDHDIQLTFMKNVDWKNTYGDTEDETTNAQHLAAWEKYLAQYDMIVMGYQDVAMYTDSTIFHTALKNFLASGKSIIVSHDMIKDNQFNGERERSVYEGELRDICGQRKRNYDATTKSLIPVEGEDGDNATQLFRRNYIEGAGMHADRSDVNGQAPPAVDRSGEKAGLGNYITRYVGIANQSQLTEYPYAIPDVIATSTTHGQNFQLDLEQREKGDVSVWFNLTDSCSSRYYDQLSADGFDLADGVTPTNDNHYIYSSREADSANNFYIYNAGNVTYTGVGHQNDMTPDEVRLFINTMIAAYRTTPDDPTIDITNKDVIETGEDSYTMYINMDDQVVDAASLALPVNLKVRDTSIVPGKTYTMQIYEEGQDANTSSYATKHPLYIGEKIEDDGEWVLGDNGRQKVELDESTKNLTVEQNKNYYFEVPYQEVKDKGKVTVNVSLTSFYRDSSGNGHTTISETNITILPLDLYDLN
ncbi:MAG: DUF5057 domain-containing protein [Lachnospiraceae bacterium]